MYIYCIPILHSSLQSVKFQIWTGATKIGKVFLSSENNCLKLTTSEQVHWKCESVKNGYQRGIHERLGSQSDKTSRDIAMFMSSLHGLGNMSNKHCQSVLFFFQMIICFYVFLTWAVISGQSCLTKQISFAMCSPFSAVKNCMGIKDLKSRWTMQKCVRSIPNGWKREVGSLKIHFWITFIVFRLLTMKTLRKKWLYMWLLICFVFVCFLKN